MWPNTCWVIKVLTTPYSYKGRFSPQVVTEDSYPLPWPCSWTALVGWREELTKVKMLAIQPFLGALAVPSLSPSTDSPATSQYSWTLRGPGGRRNKTLNNLFGETVSEEEQITFRQKNPDLWHSPFRSTTWSSSRIALVKFSFDGILIFCLDDFLATFTFRGLECSLGGNETCQSPLQKSKFKYLDHVRAYTQSHQRLSWNSQLFIPLLNQ